MRNHPNPANTAFVVKSRNPLTPGILFITRGPASEQPEYEYPTPRALTGMKIGMSLVPLILGYLFLPLLPPYPANDPGGMPLWIALALAVPASSAFLVARTAPYWVSALTPPDHFQSGSALAGPLRLSRRRSINETAAALVTPEIRDHVFKMIDAGQKSQARHFIESLSTISRWKRVRDEFKPEVRAAC